MLLAKPSGRETIIISTSLCPSYRASQEEPSAPQPPKAGTGLGQACVCANPATPTPEAFVGSACLCPPVRRLTELAQPLQEFTRSCGETQLPRLQVAVTSSTWFHSNEHFGDLQRVHVHVHAHVHVHVYGRYMEFKNFFFQIL